MSWDFQPGMQVICIDDGFEGGLYDGEYFVPHRLPMLDEILTIHDIVTGGGDALIPGDLDRIYLGFWEIDLEQSSGPVFAHGIRWCSRHFRPLQKRKTDISVFKGLLTLSKTTEDA